MCCQLASAVSDSSVNALTDMERQLRWLLPADLYAAAWIDPSPQQLMQVFEHLRTLQHILIDYVPRDVYDKPPQPGHPRYSWREGTLLFTDLAGFTPLLEAHVPAGIEGAESLLKLLNNYFSEMIDPYTWDQSLVECEPQLILKTWLWQSLVTGQGLLKAHRSGLRLCSVMPSAAAKFFWPFELTPWGANEAAPLPRYSVNGWGPDRSSILLR